MSRNVQSAIVIMFAELLIACCPPRVPEKVRPVTTKMPVPRECPAWSMRPPEAEWRMTGPSPAFWSVMVAPPGGGSRDKTDEML